MVGRAGRGFLWMACVCALAACEGAVSGGGGQDPGDNMNREDGATHLPPTGNGDSSVPVPGEDAAVGTPDSAVSMMDGSVEPPAPGCDNALFCDDFEGYGAATQPGAPWTMNVAAGASLTLSDAKHVSGNHAVHVTTNGSSAYHRAFMNLKMPFPVTGNHYYGRVYAWLKAAPNQNSHWTMIEGSGPYSGYGHSGTAKIRYGGMITQRLMANFESTGAKTDCATTSATTAPEEEWNCIEWEFDGPNNTMRYWIDGVAITDMTVVDHAGSCAAGQDLQGHWVFPNFETLSLGWEHFQTSDPIDLYLDDVAVGTQRVGCN